MSFESDLSKDLFDAINDAVIITDPEFHILFINKAACRIYNVTQEVVGQPMSSIIATALDPVARQESIVTLRQKGCWRGEAEQTTYQGIQLHVLSTISIIKDRRGKQVAVIGINRLIPGIIEQRVQLEQEVAKQTIVLKRVNEQLRMFAHTLSHDLQAPLRHMNLHASILIEEMEEGGIDLTQEMRQSMAFIRQAYEKGKALIAGALSFAHAESQDASRVPTDIGRVVRESIITNGLDLENARVNVQEGQWPWVLGDHELLNRIFNNLLVNACKFRHPDRVLEVEVSFVAQGGGMTVSLCDNGRGFAPEKNEEIFRQFAGRQFHDVPGAGVGLATCRILATKMDGTLSAEGTKNGACFRLSLPMAKAGGQDA